MASATATADAAIAKRKRGRPRKNPPKELLELSNDASAELLYKKHLYECSVSMLREQLREKSLPDVGPKETLINRLYDHWEQQNTGSNKRKSESDALADGEQHELRTFFTRKRRKSSSSSPANNNKTKLQQEEEEMEENVEEDEEEDEHEQFDENHDDMKSEEESGERVESHVHTSNSSVVEAAAIRHQHEKQHSKYIIDSMADSHQPEPLLQEEEGEEEEENDEDESILIKDQQLQKAIQSQLRKDSIHAASTVAETTAVAVSPQSPSPSSSSSPKKKKDSKRFACFYCRKAHTGCGNTRPCKRCILKGFDCFNDDPSTRGNNPAPKPIVVNHRQQQPFLHITIQTLKTLELIQCFSTPETMNYKKVKNIRGIENCERLKELNLTGNQIRKLDNLKEITTLTELWLSSNRILDISPLQSLSNLIILDLSFNLVSDVSALANLSKLRILNLSNNAYIKDISPLKYLTKLEELNLSSNKIEDISCLCAFGCKSVLTNLNMNDNDIEDLSPFTSLVNIKELHLGYNCFTDISPLIHLKRLCGVVLNNNALFQSINEDQIKLNRHYIEQLRLRGINVSM